MQQIIIGKKPVGAYKLAIITKIQENPKEIVLTARGNNISKAFKVATFFKKMKYPYELSEIKAEIEEFEGKLIPKADIIMKRK